MRVEHVRQRSRHAVHLGVDSTLWGDRPAGAAGIAQDAVDERTGPPPLIANIQCDYLFVF